MNFLKKNWGFLLFGTLALAGIITLTVFCISTNSQLKEVKGKADTLHQNLSAIGQKNIRLTQDNIDVAEKNANTLAEKQEEMKENLIKRFNVQFDTPAIVLDAFMQLKRELVEMNEFAEKHDIYVPGNGTFTFASISNATQPPLKEELPDIFRNLEIVKDILNTAAQCEVKEIDDIVRLVGLPAQADSFFNYTPIEITITAPPDVAQNFINAMSMQTNRLYILQSVKVTALDRPSAIASDLRTSMNGLESAGLPSMSGNNTSNVEDEASARAMATMTGTMKTNTPGAPGMEDPMLTGGGAKSRRKNINTTPVNPLGGTDMMAGTGMGMGTMGMNMPGLENPSGLVEVPVSRQDFLAFKKKESTWELRFDLIEFPVEESGEEAETPDDENDEGEEDEEDEENEEQPQETEGL